MSIVDFIDTISEYKCLCLFFPSISDFYTEIHRHNFHINLRVSSLLLREVTEAYQAGADFIHTKHLSRQTRVDCAYARQL